MKKFKIILTLMLFTLTGCIPTYQLPKNVKKVARLNLKELIEPRLFIDGKPYNLPIDDLGFTYVAAGKKITIGNAYAVSDSIRVDSCYPKITFIPNANYEYYLDFHIKQRTCYLSALKRPMSKKHATEG